MRPIVLLRYLLLPLHTVPLLLIVIFGVMLTIAEHAGMIGIAMFAATASAFLKYGFVLLDHIIDGRRELPVLSPEMMNPAQQRPLGLFLLLVFYYSVTALLQPHIGPTGVTVLRAILLALVPAMVASMSVTGRFVEALNPVAVVGTIVRIPLAYATLLIAIGLLWSIPVWILRSVEPTLTRLWRGEAFLPGYILGAIGMEGAITGMLALMLFMYLWLAMFACIGGTIYERRMELGIDAAESPERAAARADARLEKERDKIMDPIFASIRGGAFANAGATVRVLIEQAANPLDECRWLYARAAKASDSRLAEYLVQLILPRLLAVRASSEALQMVRERLAVQPEFRPQTAGQLLQLVQIARDAGDRAIARRLLTDFDRHYPNDPLQSLAAKSRAELER